MDERPEVLILDLGSQYTKVIGRTLREIGYRSIISSSAKAVQRLESWKPKGIILSGGSASVDDADAPQPPEGILNLNVPILGICYGMQWMAQKLGGVITREVGKKEYGSAKINLFMDDPLFSGLPSEGVDGIRTVWASHGDSVSVVPDGFK